LRSPQNARRLITAIIRARTEDLPAKTIEALRQEFGLGQEP